MRYLALLLLFACRRDPDTGGAPPDTPVGPDSPTDSPPGDSETAQPEPPISTPPNVVETPAGALKVAIVGDFGSAGPDEAAVADLIHAFDPDVVLTTGDNNYPIGSADTIDENVGQYYARYIGPYAGSYGPGSATNRFWPALGNHDWDSGDVEGFTGFFTLPGNERYYAVQHGVLDTFALDADPREPDGVGRASVQAAWLRDALAASTAPWKLVYMHHPPYSSGTHGDSEWMQWPYGGWGANLIWGGHDHDYERIEHHGMLYGVTGIGGDSVRSVSGATSGSSLVWSGDFGATFATFTADEARFRTVTVGGVVADDVTIPVGRWLFAGAPLVHEGSAWRYLDTGVFPGPNWMSPAFDDAAWAEGYGQLGFGEADEDSVVSFGADAADKHPTTWFRHTFTVDDPDTWDGLQLGLRAQDGAVVWLNGVEIHRVGLAAGPVGPDTLATMDAPTDPWTTTPVPADALIAGTNVIAVEVHLASANAPELGFDLWMDARRDAHLVRFGETWRYDDDGVEPPADWTTVAYDDSAWASGPAPLGFGGAEVVATEIDAGGDPDARKATTWYRHTFEVTDAAAIEDVLLELVRADAAVVWINGTEVLRLGVLDQAGLHAADFAADDLPEGWEALPVRTWLEGDLLVDGTNVVTAAIRVASPDRAVHRFDLALVPFP